MSFIPFLMGAAPAAGEQSTTAGFSSSIIMMVLLVAIFYFFLIRPQNKKQKETQRMLDALKKGDKIVTIGGIHGVISSIKEKTVVVKVDDNSKLEFSRSAIAGVENQTAEAPKEKKAAKKSSDETEKKSEEK